MTLGRRRVVRVPASSANLGPGFDVLAAALGLILEVEVLETGHFAVDTELDLPTDRTNLVVRAFEALHPADDFLFRITSQIPLCGGLGSSAAAIVAGLLAADSLFELDADLFALATEIEGHPDNVGAALHGGFVVCEGGRVRPIPAPEDLEALLVIPEAAVPTALARAALETEVPRRDAVANIAAACTLTLGLCTGDDACIAAGLSDRLHQPARAHLFPRSAELVRDAEALRAVGALGATVSGAGPTVLVWSRALSAGAVHARLRERTDGWAAVLRTAFTSQGADVSEL